jgi:hypothetical protein
VSVSVNRQEEKRVEIGVHAKESAVNATNSATQIESYEMPYLSNTKV